MNPLLDGRLPGEVVVALGGAVAGTGVLLVVLAVLPRPRDDSGQVVARPPSRLRGVARAGGRRLPAAVLAAVLTLVLTRWVVAAVGVGLLVGFWNRLLGAGPAEQRGIARTEALATWTESLRDTIAGAVGLEQAIPASAATCATALRPSLNLLVDRLRVREPLPEALLRFADDIADPSADVVCAALVLNARLRGPGLRDVLTALAVSTREELDVRRRIEASRRSVRRSVQIVLVVVLGVMGVLAVFNRPYVQPYSSVTGQFALLVVASLFLAGLVWLRRLARVEDRERFLVAAEVAP